jgi:hypothetical protein
LKEVFFCFIVQDQLKHTIQYTPFSYPVFVVWRTMPDSTKKGRIVIDIRGLNFLAIPDVYPIPSQEEILQMLCRYQFITVLDASSFFYQ